MFNKYLIGQRKNEKENLKRTEREIEIVIERGRENEKLKKD